MLLLLTFAALLAPLATAGAETETEPTSSSILCSTQDYVKIGMEMRNCQASAMANVSSLSAAGEEQEVSHEALCKTFEHIANKCTDVVKPCFSDSDWRRGRRILLAGLRGHLDASCPGIEAGEGSEDDPRHMCSEDKEAQMGARIGECIAQMQGTMIDAILHGLPPYYADATDAKDLAVDSSSPSSSSSSFCHHVTAVRDACIVRQLAECHSGADYAANVALLSESLRDNAATVLAGMAEPTPDPDDWDVSVTQCAFEVRSAGAHASLTLALSVALAAAFLALLILALVLFWRRRAALLTERLHKPV